MAEASPARTIKTVAGGSMAETIGGIAAVILAILGLTQVMPLFMASVATIIIGVALLLEGASIASRYSELTPGGPERAGSADVGGGVSAEFLGGVAGIVLGILALVGVAPLVLLSVAVIIFGGAAMAGGSASSRINALTNLPAAAEDRELRAMRTAVDTAASSQALVGIAAVVLGVLALLGLSPLVLVLIALLVVGAAVLLSGAAVSGKMFTVFRRT